MIIMSMFDPHHVDPEISICKYDGFSIITGGCIAGFEVMDPEGEIHRFSTLDEVSRLMEQREEDEK